MSQNKLTPKQEEQIINFFNSTISVEAFTTDMRKLLYTTAYNYIKNDVDENPRDIEGGFYWLTEFVEVLHPSMED